ncbi:UDP-N-acetylglucosamine:LPS N-acetylglucosamine transferase [Dyadobacter koreensis]|uniref:UDP-N-acetylglucosamine:LPS N-acetylglucosamine transferase n=1 Tax=Dyadobacter koreensis TaxID=408657 RepID=A0A1H6QDF2_9BACT|nr:glycosyltransferase [Dyadobacter koreensis]SEI41729.1 UDP-N-acetylglucosamine:LPS N-acetylglucosamine transferase [Dyadobacter koreensis]
MPGSLNILLAPLDWGLGHATRCIPLIRYLLEKHCQVTLAAQGATATLLKSNFPGLTILPIPGYHIQYSSSGKTLPFKILLQIPKILTAIQKERRWLRRIQQQNRYDLVISDNRYGLKIKGVPSLILTHQLLIKTGGGAFLDQILRRIHYGILEKFDGCWVVDEPDNKGIGGQLSHPGTIPVNARYIGILSQLVPAVRAEGLVSGEILILLSGPEPQRSILERLILAQIPKSSGYQFILVGGQPDGHFSDEIPANTVYFSHRNAAELTRLISRAELVVCRSGYSTLMDLAFMGKKALLIPTPGQSEQTYLATYLNRQGLFFVKSQSSLDLKTDLEKALAFPGFSEDNTYAALDAMKKAVDDVIGKLRP